MRYPLFIFLIPLFLGGCRKSNEPEGAGKDWAFYLGDKASRHYSTLKTINLHNVDSLEVAWTYHTGDDISDNHSQIQCNPLIIEGVLYGTSPRVKAFALDAGTGRRLWEFDPDTSSKSAKNVNRGLTYWRDGNDRRILFTAGADLMALNALTGKLIPEFGRQGRVSLKEGLGERSSDLYVVATTPGVVYHDLLIIGSRVSENAGGAPGFIRAYNIRNGKLAWVFKTIPQHGEFGADSWPDSALLNAGGVNCWAGMSLDEELGLLFVPTGSASYDFWGGNRKGANLFSDCILALDAATGKRIWHFQTVHHDLWDRDLPAPPVLFTCRKGRRNIKALAQVTKSGFVYVLDRKTGKPLFPVEEHSVPPSDLKDETAWPTQPQPVLPPPFVPQLFTTGDISDISPASHAYVEKILNNVRTGQSFIPPSTQGTMIFPGFDGGAEWGGAAVDPDNSILYVNANIMPWILTMVELDQQAINKSGAGEWLYQVNCAVCHGPDRQGDPTGTQPPLRTLGTRYNEASIIDLLNNGRGAMPSFRQLKYADKKALSAYLLNEISVVTHESKEKDHEPVIVPYSHTGYNRFLDQDGYPAVKPPWGTLTAINLNQGSIAWQVPLGEYPELTSRGIPKTGTENYGGPVITAGGLLFIGASRDGYFRAFDRTTGKELWKYKLPAGGYATPSVYESNGKQYVVIACGGGKMGTPSGDQYVAFALRGASR